MADTPATASPVIATLPQTGAAWYDQLPGWVRAATQVGAFGLIMALFAWQSREQAIDLRQVQEDGRLQAREDRAMFREESKANREELRSAVGEMRRAIDRLDTSHREIKSDVKTLKDRSGASNAPDPREK